MMNNDETIGITNGVLAVIFNALALVIAKRYFEGNKGNTAEVKIWVYLIIANGILFGVTTTLITSITGIGSGQAATDSFVNFARSFTTKFSPGALIFSLVAMAIQVLPSTSSSVEARLTILCFLILCNAFQVWFKYFGDNTGHFICTCLMILPSVDLTYLLMKLIRLCKNGEKDPTLAPDRSLVIRLVCWFLALTASYNITLIVSSYNLWYLENIDGDTLKRIDAVFNNLDMLKLVHNLLITVINPTVLLHFFYTKSKKTVLTVPVSSSESLVLSQNSDVEEKS